MEDQTHSQVEADPSLSFMQPRSFAFVLSTQMRLGHRLNVFCWVEHYVSHRACDLLMQIVEMAATEEKGGCKSASATISGQGVYGRLKYESGIHRVQRVPATEASGRVHTSAASVAILPQADEVWASLLVLTVRRNSCPLDNAL